MIRGYVFDRMGKKGSEADIKEKLPMQCVIGLESGQAIPRVLVVEDIEKSRTLLVKILNTVGFDVKEAANGKEAVEIFNQWRPNFIWMDIRMLVMDGLEANRHIKKTDAGKSTIVAALTAHALEIEREHILAAGCDDFVRKPFREQDIFEVVARHLGLKYVYEAEQKDADPVKPDLEIDPQQLATLPPDLTNRLHRAVVELDKPRTLALINQVAEQDASIGSAFRMLAKKLDYGRLPRLLKEAGIR